MTSFQLESTVVLASTDSSGQKTWTPPVAHTITPPRTPTTTLTAAHALYSEIQEINDTLSALTSLSPGDQVNRLLTRLVDLCIRHYSAEFTTQFLSIRGATGLCDSLRSLCATAEGELEAYWARRIIMGSQTMSTYTLYPAPI
jgi:nicotianamine synthase